MYVLVKNGNVEKYPYSIGQLKQDNPNTSFPYTIPDTTLAEYGVYPVVPIEYPQVDYTKNVIEELPKLVAGIWYQSYIVIDATSDEIIQRKTNLNLQAEANRAQAYKMESDPLFFKWQRGEATEQDWVYKVSEIKARYPRV
jgi:hypothetical protein